MMNAVKQMKSKRLRRYTAFERRRSRQILFMCIPTILKTLIFSYLPMIGLIMAFQNYIPRRGIFGSEWVGFQNFEYLLKSSIASRLIFNSIFLNILFTVFGTVVSLLLGLFLFEIGSKLFVKISQTVLVFPYFASWPLVGVLLSALISSENGMITKFIESAFSVTLNFYAMPELWPGILTFVNVWKVSGLSAVVYYAILIGVDREIYEAAEMDGAGKFRTMWSISLPYLKQMVILNIIMSSVNVLRMDFNMIYFVTNNSATLYPTTDVIETYMFRALRTEGDISVAAATGLIQGVVGLILTLLLNWLSKRTLGESLY